MAKRGGRRVKPSYDSCVFINCPLDSEYAPLFRALVFTIQDCGFVARCALEIDDSGEVRASKIIRLINESRLGIHDISRTELNPNNLPRFNMPFELGIFIGCKHSADVRQKRKKALILDREAYRYQQFISDIAGQDIRSHGGNEQKLIQEVRHWLQNQTDRSIPGSKRIIDRFAEFLSEIPAILERLHKSNEDLTNYHDFHNLVCTWIAEHTPS
jgi:hypothetical protein